LDADEDSITKAAKYHQVNEIIFDGKFKSNKMTFFEKTIANLENVLIRKINEASHKVFCDASKNVNPETLNFEHTYGSDDLFYCFWANLSHNPK
jgi:hypothetical protein